MILISHRGNINGRVPNLENSPDFIDAAIEKKYDVEIDLRTHNGKLFLGHDEPQYEIDIEYSQETLDRWKAEEEEVRRQQAKQKEEWAQGIK